MKEVVSQLGLMCRMQGKPESFQVPVIALLVIVVLNAVFSISLQILGKPVEFATSIDIVMIGFLVDALAISGLLLFKSVKERLVSVMAAVFGADLILTLVAVPAILMVTYMDSTPWQAVSAFFQMVLLGWNLAVRGFIYHRNMRIGIIQANVLSFTLFLLTMFLITQLHPELISALPTGDAS